VFDDPEVDDVLNVLKASTYDLILSMQVQYPDWRNRSLAERRDVFFGPACKLRTELGSFDSFDAHMRLDLASLSEYKVDYEKFPYGQDNGSAGIYKTRHGSRYFVGVKPWVTENNVRPIFLTTEEVLTEVIMKAFRNQIMKLDCSNLPGVYPIRVPICFTTIG